MLRLTAKKTYLYTGKRFILLDPEKHDIPRRVRSICIGGRVYLCIRDLIRVVCRKDTDHSNEVWRRLSKERKGELVDYMREHQFPGQRQSRQPVITLEGALKLIMRLPGEAAKSVHSRVAAILSRHFQDNTDRFTGWLLDTADQVQAEIDARESVPKYVYCAESANFPGLVKIGHAADLSTRMVQANVFNAPVPFHVAAHVSSMDRKGGLNTLHLAMFVSRSRMTANTCCFSWAGSPVRVTRTPGI